MKAFEEYMKKNYPNIYPNTGDYIHSLQMWRGALKEALKHETDLQPTELGDWIREELKKSWRNNKNV